MSGGTLYNSSNIFKQMVYLHHCFINKGTKLSCEASVSTAGRQDVQTGVRSSGVCSVDGTSVL